jgi:hypothetical protein
VERAKKKKSLFPDLNLIYMPTKEIMKSENKINMFRSFRSFEGAKEFEKKAK